MTNPAATTARSIATLRSAWGRAEVAHEKANRALYIAEKAGRKADGARTRERAAWGRLCEAKAAHEAAAAAAPAVSCAVCGDTHEVTAEDRVGDCGDRVSEDEAMEVAHFRLAVLARSAQPFQLFGRVA